jgi:hypothetical protein
MAVSDAISELLHSTQQLMKNKDFVSATGASPAIVSKTLFRMKGKRIRSVGESNKEMAWGLLEWFDENGELKAAYK